MLYKDMKKTLQYTHSKYVSFDLKVRSINQDDASEWLKASPDLDDRFIKTYKWPYCFVSTRNFTPSYFRRQEAIQHARQEVIQHVQRAAACSLTGRRFTTHVPAWDRVSHKKQTEAAAQQAQHC